MRIPRPLAGEFLRPHRLDSTVGAETPEVVLAVRRAENWVALGRLRSAHPRATGWQLGDIRTSYLLVSKHLGRSYLLLEYYFYDQLQNRAGRQ
jgi:hypothetical protein